MFLPSPCNLSIDFQDTLQTSEVKRTLISIITEYFSNNSADWVTISTVCKIWSPTATSAWYQLSKSRRVAAVLLRRCYILRITTPDESTHTFEFEQHSAQLLIRRICNPLNWLSGSTITRAVTVMSSASAVTTTVPVDGLLVLGLFFDIIDSVSSIQSTDSTCHIIYTSKLQRT